MGKFRLGLGLRLRKSWELGRDDLSSSQMEGGEFWIWRGLNTVGMNLGRPLATQVAATFIKSGLPNRKYPLRSHLDERRDLGDYVDALLIESSGGAGPVKLRQPGSS